MSTMKIRSDKELPEAVAAWGWKYHHTGVPTEEIRPNEKYLPQFKMHVSGFNTSPYGIEWMRFEKGSPIHTLIRTVTHVAFVVDDLDAELKRSGMNVITEPNPPSDGVRVAMVEHDGAPIELIEF